MLYIYGGTFEKGDREFTFDDLYAIDLVKLDGCKEVFNREVENWVVSSPFSSSRAPCLSLTNISQGSDDEDDDEEDDEWDDDEDEDMDDEEGGDDVEMGEEIRSPSTRKKKLADEVSMPDTASTVDTEDTEDTAATSLDDGLPHPRVSCTDPGYEKCRALANTLLSTAIRNQKRFFHPYFQRVAGDSHDQLALEEHRTRDSRCQGDQDESI